VAPLKTIISETIGCRALVDLIDTQKPDGDYEWVLRYVDHHSGFRYVAPSKNKSSKSVGYELLKIFGTAVIPEVLQSDNGT
jgi:hypothetical protein